MSTPEDIREMVAEMLAGFDGNTLGEGTGIKIADHDKEKYRRKADLILKRVAECSA